jgi:hypothetical protein
MPPNYNFSSNDFKEFCKDNNLTAKEGFDIVLNKINDFSKQLEGDNG